MKRSTPEVFMEVELVSHGARKEEINVWDMSLGFRWHKMNKKITNINRGISQRWTDWCWKCMKFETLTKISCYKWEYRLGSKEEESENKRRWQEESSK